MKTNGQPKIRGGSAAELTRLKALPAEERAEIWSWRSELDAEKSPLTNAAIRGRIQERFGIRLNHDGQLSTFWQWQYRQLQYDRLGEIASEDEELLARKLPDVDRDKIREKTILRMYALADLEEDPKFGLKVVATDLKDSVERREWAKYRDNVEARKQAIQEALDKSKSTGGITPATMEQIEKELKLL